MATIPCPECSGSTEVFRLVGAVMKLVRCSYCKGDGEVRWEE